MVVSCCAYGCTERAFKGCPVTFHCFPKDEGRRKIWETKIHRENFKATKSSRLCSKHFTPDCFDREKFGGTWLKKTAVPTIFDFPKHLIEKKITRKPVVRKTPEPKPIVVQASRKRMYYVGDFDADDMNSPTKARKLLSIAQSQQKILTMKIKNTQRKTKRLEKKLFTMKEMLADIKRKSLASEPAVNLLKTMFDGPALEILLRTSGHKKGKYAPELRSFALTLHFYSKKAYLYVRKVFKTCLPHTSTIKKWYQVVDGSPGLTKEALEVLKCKAVEATEKNKQIICCLIIDEMSIRKHIEVDNGKLSGYIDYGTDFESDELKIAKDALTLMVNAVNENWKIPIGYFLIHGLEAIEKANLIKIALEYLHDTGIKVVAVTFDGLPCNFKVGEELGARLEAVNLKSAFAHPITGEDVFIFLDPCHCLKLVRNILASKGSMFDNNHHIIAWNYIVKLEKVQQEEGLLAGTKIRNRHIQWYNEKMKVKLAAQTLSESVANALDWLANDLKKSEFKGCDATIRFIRVFDKLFDSLNSRNLLSKGFKSPIKIGNASTIFDFYNECDSYIRNLTISKDGINLVFSKCKTGFLGFLICIESVKSLYKSLIEPAESPMSFLMTYKFSQDHLETFFSMIRSRGGYNDNPSAKQFKSAYKQLLVRHEIASSENCNCISLSNINILNVSSKDKSKNNFVQKINHDVDRHLSGDLQSIDNSQTVISDHAYSILPSSPILSEYIEDVVAHISGFVQRKLISIIKCEECSTALISDKNSEENSFRLINRKNKGGLIKPNKNIYKLCKIGEKNFRIIQAAGKLNSKNVLELLIADSMRKINTNVFSVLNDHILDQNTSDNHIIALIKSVFFEYFTIRLCHVAKSITASLQINKVRSKNTRLTIFKGH